MVSSFVEGVLPEPGIVLFNRDERNFLGGGPLVIRVVSCEPILDVSSFSNSENGLGIFDGFPKGSVICPQSDASKDIRLEAGCIIFHIFIKDLEDSWIVLENIKFEQVSDIVVKSSIICLGRKMKDW